MKRTSNHLLSCENNDIEPLSKRRAVDLDSVSTRNEDDTKLQLIQNIQNYIYVPIKPVLFRMTYRLSSFDICKK